MNENTCEVAPAMLFALQQGIRHSAASGASDSVPGCNEKVFLARTSSGEKRMTAGDCNKNNGRKRDAQERTAISSVRISARTHDLHSEQ